MLFDAPLTGEALTTVAVPVHVVEGSATSAVDHAICDVVLRHVPQGRALRHRGSRALDPRSATLQNSLEPWSLPSPGHRGQAPSSTDDSRTGPETAAFDAKQRFAALGRPDSFARKPVAAADAPSPDPIQSGAVFPAASSGYWWVNASQRGALWVRFCSPREAGIRVFSGTQHGCDDSRFARIRLQRAESGFRGGGGGIRTPRNALKRSTVFLNTALDSENTLQMGGSGALGEHERE